jgi:hypothetical protein
LVTERLIINTHTHYQNKIKKKTHTFAILERIASSETSAPKAQTPGDYPKDNTVFNHGKSFKSRHIHIIYEILFIHEQLHRKIVMMKNFMVIPEQF